MPGEREVHRCEDCGGIIRGYGEWVEAVAVCICTNARHPSQGVKRDGLPADLSHGGHLANPWAFSELVGRGDK
jgi:hypothetical protein